MDLLQYAARLNQEGASLLSANNDTAAFEYFRNALEVMLLGVPEGREVMSDSPDLVSAAHSLLLQPRFYHCLLWTCNNTNAGGSATTTAAAAVPPPRRDVVDARMFSKAFVFQPQEDNHRDPAVRIRTYLAIIFFNLATTLHQRSSTGYTAAATGSGAAGSSGSCFDRALTVALDLYDVGFDLLIQEENCCGDDWSTSISLAILNNMAEVHWARSDFAKASRVLELQKGLLDIIVDNKRPHNFSEKEMDLFILNIHLLQAPSGAAAA